MLHPVTTDGNVEHFLLAIHWLKKKTKTPHFSRDWAGDKVSRSKEMKEENAKEPKREKH